MGISPTLNIPRARFLAMPHTLPVYDILEAADRFGDTLPMNMNVPKAKEIRYWSGIPSFDPHSATAVNQVENVQAAFAIRSRATTFYKDAA